MGGTKGIRRKVRDMRGEEKSRNSFVRRASFPSRQASKEETGVEEMDKGSPRETATKQYPEPSVKDFTPEWERPRDRMERIKHDNPPGVISRPPGPT